MRSSLILRCVSAVCLTAFLAAFSAAPPLLAQGGEPQYFAIRGAKVVPVSEPPIENATIVMTRGLIAGMKRPDCLSRANRFVYRRGDSCCPDCGR